MLARAGKHISKYPYISLGIELNCNLNKDLNEGEEKQ